MKNLITLVSENEIHDFVSQLWKSDIFRASYEKRGFIYDQVQRFAWLPRFFCEMSCDHLERAHFSTWWNVITIRDDYDNPIIHDLYYLHEMAHAASMPYIGGLGRAAFDEKMQRNELEASVLSEITVYFELEGLRETSFPYEIYADRFLQDRDLVGLWITNPALATEKIRTIRRDVMTSKPIHLMDDREKWIRRFTEQNAAYSITWADSYDDVEQQMEAFQIKATRDPHGASVMHRAWLELQMALDPKDQVPFRQEAELFSPFYWSNKDRYAKAMTSGK